nr:MAG TPA: hypothetical protein [Caudoviricetes sp.]
MYKHLLQFLISQLTIHSTLRAINATSTFFQLLIIIVPK